MSEGIRIEGKVQEYRTIPARFCKNPDDDIAVFTYAVCDFVRHKALVLIWVEGSRAEGSDDEWRGYEYWESIHLKNRLALGISNITSLGGLSLLAWDETEIGGERDGNVELLDLPKINLQYPPLISK